ncbi:hypothetical protein EV06_0148 [Prochlorococcus sp. MIT 0602]|nr:hypothetical protein EV07_1412 [Prochlorococcus sp. MIT 0603]KGG18022.1 hypothetical protein EV06_0148 [Prochlorococcus sp. MIT 0602]
MVNIKIIKRKNEEVINNIFILKQYFGGLNRYYYKRNFCSKSCLTKKEIS